MRNKTKNKLQKRGLLRLLESKETPGENPASLQEAVALRDLIEQVRIAFRAKFNKRNEWGAVALDYWDVDVFDTFAVARYQGKMYRAAFAMKDGDVVFEDTLETVEVEFVPTKTPAPKATGMVMADMPMMESVTETPEITLGVIESFRESAEEGPFRALEAVDKKGWVWEVTIMKTGRTKERMVNGVAFTREYPKAVLQEAVTAKLFENVEVFAFSEKEHAAHPGQKGVRDAVGFIESVKMVGDEVRGHLHIYKDATWLRDRWVGLKESGHLARAGLSIDANGKGKLKKDGTTLVQEVTALIEASSVEVVHSPAAGGTVVRLVASTEENIIMNWEQLLKFLESTKPELFQKYKDKKAGEVEIEVVLKEAMSVPPTSPAAPAAKPAPPATPTEGVETVASLRESFREEIANERARVRCEATLERRLVESGLPDASKKFVRRLFAEKDASGAEQISIFESQALEDAIREQKDYLASLRQQAPTSLSGVTITKDEHDQKLTLLEAMFWSGPNDHEHKNYPAHLKGVRPYRSLLRAYKDFTGFHDATPEEVLKESRYSAMPWGYAGNKRLEESWRASHFQESVTSGTWGEALGNVMNKRLLAEYNLPDMQSWRKITSDIGNINDFRPNRRIRIGGYGVLPAVAEGGTYQALTSPTDAEETYSVAKYGGLEDLTWETIRNDDVNAVRRIPVNMGRAAIQTLYRNVFDMVEDNDTLADGVALISTATHVNRITSILGNAALTQGKQQMMDQTSYGNSYEVLGMANIPRYLLHPNELAETAWQLTRKWSDGQGEHDNSDRNANFHSSYGLEPLNVPYYANATYFWLVANPANIQTIEVGFLDGREEPEMFIQDDPNVGSNFTADKITYKERHVHGALLVDYRGFAGYIG